MTLQYLFNKILILQSLCQQQEIYLLGRIGDVIKDNPRIVQFVLNVSIRTLPLCPPVGRAEAYISINLLLLNIGDIRENVTVTVGVSWIDIPNPLINVV